MHDGKYGARLSKYAHLYVHTILQANLSGDIRSETPKRAFFGWEMPTKSNNLLILNKNSTFPL
jgi:hypothetical protein